MSDEIKPTIITDEQLRMKSWWSGDPRVEPYMGPVKEAISRHIPMSTDAWTDVYNRAYEAIYKAIIDMEKTNRFSHLGLKGSDRN